jgi:hypothetical protein
VAVEIASCVYAGTGVKEGLTVADASVVMETGTTVNVGFWTVLSERTVDVGAASLADGVGIAMNAKEQQQHIEMIDVRTVMIFAVKPDFQKLVMCFTVFSLLITGTNFNICRLVDYLTAA